MIVDISAKLCNIKIHEYDWKIMHFDTFKYDFHFCFVLGSKLKTHIMLISMLTFIEFQSLLNQDTLSFLKLCLNLTSHLPQQHGFLRIAQIYNIYLDRWIVLYRSQWLKGLVSPTSHSLTPFRSSGSVQVKGCELHDFYASLRFHQHPHYWYYHRLPN